MTKGKSPVSTNRNGALGDFAAFAPRRKTLEEIIRDSIASAAEDEAPAGRTSSTILDLGRFILVRYQLNSDELTRDCLATGLDRQRVSLHYPEYFGFTAVFGILDRERDAAVAVIEVMGDDDLAINHAFRAKDADIPVQVMIAVLNHLDVPANRRNGIDSLLTDRFDVERCAETGIWSACAPLHVVVVRFERLCFQTTPSLIESTDVFVPVDPANDISDPDPEKAYWAKSHYKDEAWTYFHKQVRTEVRPGFSSWLTSGDPRLVKVVNPEFRKRVDALIASDKAD